jgi:hypothetical protein
MDVKITIGETAIEMPVRVFQVLMTAVNREIDTGDGFILFGEVFTRNEIAKARDISGEIFFALTAADQQLPELPEL